MLVSESRMEPELSLRSASLTVNEEWPLDGRVEDWIGGPTMDQGSRLTVDEEWEEGRLEGPTMDCPLRHAASTAKGHCNVTIFYHVSNKVTIS